MNERSKYSMIKSRRVRAQQQVVNNLIPPFSRHCDTLTMHEGWLYYVKRMSIYVQMKMTRTRMTIPSVMHVVPLPFRETVDKCFLDERVAVKLPGRQRAVTCSSATVTSSQV